MATPDSMPGRALAAPGLQPNAFAPLPLGHVRPGGWLRRQLEIQAAGLSGALDTFWPDIQDSRWFGGVAEGWERAPYWLDGVVPLAFLLDAGPLRERVVAHVDTIIRRQAEDGWLGPVPEKRERHDIWALFLALKMLVVYHDASGDERVPGVVARALRCIDQHIERHPLFNWAQFRWFEALIAISWLHERQPEAWLADLATTLHAQGFDWRAFFERWPLTGPTPRGRWTFMGHVVNNAMALKAQALWWRFSGGAADRIAPAVMLAALDRHHGMATGMFTGDECLAGTSPVQGTELCAVVEAMYSLELLLATLGDPAFGDRLEQLAFNALPATFSPDMWAHQYDQQVNQIECSVRAGRCWTTNGADANIFGLEPNYGCCTANLSQGWPKFAAHLWMRPAAGGLAAMAWAPCEVRTSVGGVPVQVAVETDYPFRATIDLAVTVAQPTRFPLQCRIPGWATGATVYVAGESPTAALPGRFHVLERDWAAGTTRLRLTLPMLPTVQPRPRGAVAIERGPLLYALRIAEEWRQVNLDKPLRTVPHADWEVHPTSPWNVALDIDPAGIGRDIVFSEHPVGPCPFSPDGAPVSATAPARRVPEWVAENGAAGPMPPSPVRAESATARVTLIPYGCTNLRIAEFPLCARTSTASDAETP